MNDLNGSGPNLTIPPVPLPLQIVAAPISASDGSMVILVWSFNGSGSGVCGVLDPEQAQAAGRQLLALGREAALRITKPPKQLIVPGGVHVVPDEPILAEDTPEDDANP